MYVLLKTITWGAQSYSMATEVWTHLRARSNIVVYSNHLSANVFKPYIFPHFRCIVYWN